jgi:hypothetical protein
MNFIKANHIYLLLFLVSTCVCSSLRSQQNLPSDKLARRAVTIDAFTVTTSGNSINWHQPILVLKQKSNGNNAIEKGYLNASIGLGSSFFPEPGISIPHSITLNIRIQASETKARFVEMGYGGLAWQSMDNNYIYSSIRHRNEYGGGLLIGYRSNGPITSKNTFVFRINGTLMVHKDQAFGNFCLLDSWDGCRKPRNILVVRPLINLSFGIGF